MTSDKLNYINFNQKELDVLFRSSLAGDSKAFQKLSAHVRDIAFSYFQSKQRQGKIINTDDVDDLANNVYLAFAEQYHKVENLEFWLRRVLFLSFINWYKKNKANRTFELEEARYLHDPNSFPDHSIDAEKINSIIDTLAGDKQKIIRMRFYEDLKFSDIAIRLNKSEDAIKKMFYRTLGELRDKF